MIDSFADRYPATTFAVAAFVVSTIFLILFLTLCRKKSEPAHDPSISAILISGGRRGIGKATADHLLSLGYHVFVTVRKQWQYEEMEAAAKAKDGAPAPHPVLLDVSNDDHTRFAVIRVEKLLKTLDCNLIAIVNNAGINPEGDSMSEVYANGGTPKNVLADTSVATRVLQTNVVGVARVTRAFLRLIPSGGRIVNIGSYFGSIAGQAGLWHAYYECSKYALEGFSDNMRRSLRKKGIHVSLVKPGNISTDMNSFGESPAIVVARDVEHAISSKRPKPRYYPGKVKGMHGTEALFLRALASPITTTLCIPTRNCNHHDLM